MKLIVLAFSLCYLIGLIRAKVQPLIVKNHGYKQHSYFRSGYDYMIQQLNQNLCHTICLILLCMKDLEFELKTQKIISVM